MNHQAEESAGNDTSSGLMNKSSGNQVLAALLARSAEGDRSAFSDLHRLTSAKLFGIVIRILGRQDLAEDALQESFVAIWKRAGDYDAAIASPIAWMATIARNKAIDIKRLKAERVSAGSVPMDEDLPSTLLTPLDETERSERLKGLLKCLEELPADRRQMVLLAYLQGWSREEIATKFSRPVPTVKTILRRSLAILKGCLDGQE